MKKYRIVLLVVAVLVLGLPPVFGMLTESQVHAQAESLREQGRLLVTVEEYDRGWFTSRALLLVAPGPAVDPSELALFGFVEPMKVVADFKHGPLSVHDGLFLGFSELLARPAPTADAAAPFDFEFRAQSTFGGAVNFAGEIMPFEAETDELALGFSGGSFHGTVAGEHRQAWLDADAVQLTHGPATYSLFGVRASVDNERVSRYVQPGVMALEVERMSMDIGANGSAAERSTVFDLRALAVESSTALDDTREHMSAALRIELERLLVAGEEITSARLESAAERLDVAALGAFSDAAERASETGVPLVDEAEPAILRLLAQGPVVSIDTLTFSVGGEPLEASAQATADGAALPPAGAADVRDSALWTSVIDGQAELIVSKELTERVAVMIARSQIGARIMDGESMPGQSIDALARVQAGLALAMLSAQGLIEDTGELYRAELRLVDGNLTVNGQSLPFFGLP